MRRVAATFSSALVLLVAASASVSSMTSPAQAAASCDGTPATIEGTPGQERLLGTSGPDVIVSNGAKEVYAEEGEDLVCMTGGDATVVLDGVNEYEDTGAFAADKVIGTGGDDFVNSGGSITFVDFNSRTVNPDTYDLGSGDSTVYAIGVPTGSIDAGTGRDRLYLFGGGTRLSINVPDETMGFTGQPAAHLSGVESFHLSRSLYTSLYFTGSSASESLYVYPISEPDEFNYVPERAYITLGGGTDFLALPGDTRGSASGGPGRDRFAFLALERDAGRVRLAAGRISGKRLAAKVTSFEGGLDVSQVNVVRVVGDSTASTIRVSACNARVDARGGADRVVVTTPAYCRNVRHLLDGGPGADRLQVDRGRNVLVGGPGRDYARGGRNQDRCVAERTKACES